MLELFVILGIASTLCFFVGFGVRAMTRESKKKSSFMLLWIGLGGYALIFVIALIAMFLQGFGVI